MIPTGIVTPMLKLCLEILLDFPFSGPVVLECVYVERLFKRLDVQTSKSIILCSFLKFPIRSSPLIPSLL